MCHALLHTCRHCTWLLTITYPRCSHAKAYAIDPPACPYRMKRRYKSAGLCAACKSNASPWPSGAHQEHRKGSLSVTPCEVLVKFRDTEIGRVEEADRARTPPAGTRGSVISNRSGMGSRNEERRNGSVDEEMEIGTVTRKTRTRAKKRGARKTHTLASFIEEDSDGDVYIDNASPSTSLSSASSFTSSSSDVPPRKPKSSTRAKPLPKPRGQAQTRKRRRSPGVLERIQNADRSKVPVKKGRRGRPPKQKMIWPDRIDAVAFDQVAQERSTGKTKSRPGRPVVVTPDVQVRAFSPVYLEQSVVESSRAAQKHRPSYHSIGAPFVLETAKKPTRSDAGPASVIDEGDDLARIIAREASRRDKKWR
ncbi:hypothetical protein BU23DRAFT_563113 [Bimuria novae-zelandiae CBS 107.79]|uniref:Uncharacterized protein n=1 Tax=Bimuria novae-zelandiae CBS 107.79 TaxID=1447943 RepID=A0A6A5VR51_9PLEO|nr:hypothetical protein BU23DRAFT_563113 [Bimuria novae-zelandiae CBS 107.79]